MSTQRRGRGRRDLRAGDLQVGALQALTWDGVDLAAGLISVERGWDQKQGPVEPKSAAGFRRTPIAAVLRDYLVQHRVTQDKDKRALVFGRTDGTPFSPSTVAQRAERAWRAGGLEPVTLHECRHTFATLMIAAGVNAKALQAFMGHSSITVTLDRYGHLFPGSEEQAARLLDAYLKDAHERARRAEIDPCGKPEFRSSFDVIGAEPCCEQAVLRAERVFGVYLWDRTGSRGSGAPLGGARVGSVEV